MPIADDPVTQVFEEFLELTRGSESSSILELGSRNVSGHTRRHLFDHCDAYTGFDVREGENVDVTGDAHKLSSVFEPNQFDFIFSFSVFEHLLFPWKVALEFNKILKPGGYVYIQTHPAWPEHEMPWDFWRFPKSGFHALFNEHTGFQLLTSEEGSPAKIYSLVAPAASQGNWRFHVNQAVGIIARKTGEYRSDLVKWDIDVEDVTTTMYPEKQ